MLDWLHRGAPARTRWACGALLTAAGVFALAGHSGRLDIGALDTARSGTASAPHPGSLRAQQLAPATPRGASPAPRVAAGRPARAVPPTAASTRTRTPVLRPVPVVYRVRTARRVVFLTLDDGVTRLPATVAWFARHRIPATAFLTDSDIDGQYGYFRTLQRLGVQVENHTVHHRWLPGRPLSAQRAELCTTSARFARAFGRRPTLFRPPYGGYDTSTRVAARACGMSRVVSWSATVHNGAIRYASGAGLRPGDIVLLHFTPRTVADLDVFLRAARRARLQPAALEHYLR